MSGFYKVVCETRGAPWKKTFAGPFPGALKFVEANGGPDAVVSFDLIREPGPLPRFAPGPFADAPDVHGFRDVGEPAFSDGRGKTTCSAYMADVRSALNAPLLEGLEMLADMRAVGDGRELYACLAACGVLAPLAALLSGLGARRDDKGRFQSAAPLIRGER